MQFTKNPDHFFFKYFFPFLARDLNEPMSTFVIDKINSYFKNGLTPEEDLRD